ncbi:hypothetical protein L9F63_004035, partial [Diploptera punctata]
YIDAGVYRRARVVWGPLVTCNKLSVFAAVLLPVRPRNTSRFDPSILSIVQ